MKGFALRDVITDIRTLHIAFQMCPACAGGRFLSAHCRRLCRAVNQELIVLSRPELPVFYDGFGLDAVAAGDTGAQRHHLIIKEEPGFFCVHILSIGL